MLTAKIMQEQGVRQQEISSRLGVCERTVRNYLKSDGMPKERKKRASKLDPYKDMVNSIINEDPHYNCELLFEKLFKSGYRGRISILRDYVKTQRQRVLTDAVIRFETIPGLQAQVDWKDFGRQQVGDREIKLYAFVMILGYSRTPFIRFTESMRSNILLRCHLDAFRYFGGIPSEILYDNMKTAFVADGAGMYQVNRDMLAFAAHYGFEPKRCRVRRPQTKGKVERAIGFVQTNFWPRVAGAGLSIDELNAAALEWIESIMDKHIGGMSESRRERLAADQHALKSLPVAHLDLRRSVVCTVNRESCIVFETNKYSIHPDFIGQNVCLRVDDESCMGEIYDGLRSLRVIELHAPGMRRTFIHNDDRAEILKRHDADRRKRLRLVQARTRSKQTTEVEVRHPSAYEAIAGGGQ
jgi:transposase